MRRHEIYAKCIRKIRIETQGKSYLEVFVVKTPQGKYNYYIQRKSGRFENLAFSQIIRKAMTGHIHDLNVFITENGN